MHLLTDLFVDPVLLSSQLKQKLGRNVEAVNGYIIMFKVNEKINRIFTCTWLDDRCIYMFGLFTELNELFPFKLKILYFFNKSTPKST